MIVNCQPNATPIKMWLPEGHPVEEEAERRRLRTATEKSRFALRALEKAKRENAFGTVLVNKESEYLKASRDVGNAEKEIKDLEVELMGDWAPKSRGDQNAVR